MRILIIEDEQELAGPLKKTLENEGFAVDYAEDGQQGYNLAKLNSYDCLILDLNLPKMDGLKVAEKLREDSKEMPIIMLTARSQIYNKLEGFEFGADDYVTKPFDLAELIARIKAVMRRHSFNSAQRLKFGPHELIAEENLVLLKVNNKTKEVEITTKESGILEYLIRQMGRIVSTEELLEHVWDREVDLFTETVKTHIKTLRNKIDPDKNIIKTVRNKGYKIDL